MSYARSLEEARAAIRMVEPDNFTPGDTSPVAKGGTAPAESNAPARASKMKDGVSGMTLKPSHYEIHQSEGSKSMRRTYGLDSQP